MDFAITRINADPELMRKVWLQLTHFKDAIQIPEKRKEELFAWAIDLTKKLMSVKYHRDNLLRILNEEFEKRSKATESTNVTVVDVSTGAERELEAFLMQGKSSLDVLVKIFVPIFGIKIHTYGDGGNKVAKTLRGNLKVEQLVRAEHLLRLIEQDKEWIEKWFGARRDTVAHYKPIKSSGFVTPPIKDGIPRHAPPMTEDGVPFHEVVVTLYENLLTFCEDFIALTVSITFPPAFVIGVIPEDKRDKEDPLKYGYFFANPPTDTPAT